MTDTEFKENAVLIGYARVSTEDQNLGLQHDALKMAGCKRILDDKASSVSNDRPGLAAALEHAREGDTMVVWKLDRLGRTVKGLIEFVEGLQQRGVEFRSLTENIDTSTAQGRMFFHIIAAFAQMERDLIRERTRAGLDAARARGRKGGRRPKMTESKKKAAHQLLAGGALPRTVAENLGISVSTLYRWMPGGKSENMPLTNPELAAIRKHEPKRRRRVVSDVVR
jgi:DNA invertase Pin-like site-specific DNA recombinase